MVVSPSGQKLGIPVKKGMSASEYSLPWIMQQIVKVNQEQIKRFKRELKGHNIKGLPYINQSIIKDSLGSTMKNNTMAGQVNQLPSEYLQLNKNERFFTAETITIMGRGFQSAGGIVKNPISAGGGGVKRTTKAAQKLLLLPSTYGEFKDVDDIEKQLVSKLSHTEQEATLYNMLVVLDDVIGDIKANENNAIQAQLFFNRRHLIANGTVSIIVVSQKYTMIPSRIRSQASWLILFRLNPNDFQAVYTDVVMVTQQKWEAILNYVYDINNEDDEQQMTKSNKTYNHLDILVEFDIFFKNFEKLTFK